MTLAEVNELYAQRASLVNKMRELAPGNVVAADNQQAFDRAYQDFQNLSRQIDAEEQLAVKSAFADDGSGAPAVDEGKKAFFNYVRTGSVSNALSTGTGSMGYTVPEELAKKIVEKMNAYGAFIPAVETVITQNTQDIPIEGDAPTMYWTEENGAYTSSDPNVGRIQLKAYKGTVLIKLSEELVADSAFDMEGYVERKSAEALSVGIETAAVANTASGKPTGILTDAELALTSSVTASFTYDDLIDLETAVKSGYARNGSFLMARTALGVVMKMKDGAGNYVYAPAPVAGEPDRVLNRPIVNTDAMPGLASGNFAVAFGDLKYYKLRLAGPMFMQRLNELYAGNGQIGVRLYQRVDGKLALGEAVKKLKLK